MSDPTTQLALLDVTTGDPDTDRLLAMLRGAHAALQQPTPHRPGSEPVGVEIAFAYDPSAPLEEQLGVFLRAAFIGWRETTTHLRHDTPTGTPAGNGGPAR